MLMGNLDQVLENMESNDVIPSASSQPTTVQLSQLSKNSVSESDSEGDVLSIGHVSGNISIKKA